MASIGPRDGAVFDSIPGLGTSEWLVPSRAQTNNSLHAQSNLSAGQQSDYLTAENFSPGIPAGNVIDGILVEIDRWSTANDIFDAECRILVGGGGSFQNAASSTRWPNATAYQSYGGATSLWGFGALTVSQVNDASFGVVYKARRDIGGFLTAPAYVDHIRVTFYYSEEAFIYDEFSVGGGILSGGSVTKTISLAPSEGGILQLGSGTLFASNTLTSNEGINLEGPNPASQEVSELSNSGAVLAGNNAPSLEAFPESSGSINVEGLGEESLQTDDSSSGGVVLAGESLPQTSKDEISAGGVILQGNGQLSTELEEDTAGGISLEGSGDEAASLTETSQEGIVLQGTGAEAATLSEDSNGGVILQGSGDVDGVTSHSEASSGGIVLEGESQPSTEYNERSIGGVVLEGVGATFLSYGEDSSTGGITLASVSDVRLVAEPLSDSGIELLGQGVVTSDDSEPISSFGIELGGSGTVSTRVDLSSIGGILVEGVSTVIIVQPSDGGHLEGTINVYSAAGGSILILAKAAGEIGIHKADGDVSTQNYLGGIINIHTLGGIINLN